MRTKQERWVQIAVAVTAVVTLAALAIQHFLGG
jgi:disulfide bond formation protein DsbB